MLGIVSGARSVHSLKSGQAPEVERAIETALVLRYGVVVERADGVLTVQPPAAGWRRWIGPAGILAGPYGGASFQVEEAPGHYTVRYRLNRRALWFMLAEGGGVLILLLLGWRPALLLVGLFVMFGVIGWAGDVRDTRTLIDIALGACRVGPLGAALTAWPASGPYPGGRSGAR